MANRLDGKRWIQNSISVWGDIRKSADELRLKHPAMFPSQLVERLIDSFLPPAGRVILDPFSGSGSTICTAARMGLQGIGLELSLEYVQLGRKRLGEVESASRDSLGRELDSNQSPLAPVVPGEGPGVMGNRTSPNPRTPSPTRPSTGARGAGSLENDLLPEIGRPEWPSDCVIHHAPAARLSEFVAADSIDLCITSPPYWNILNQQRTADLKAVRHYGNLPDDLGTISDYQEFLTALTMIFQQVLVALKPRAYCCVVVMDLRKKNQFFPFHSDLASRLQQIGFRYDDLIIWNRQSEYNNLRPLGYPSVFRVNKVHEFVLLMQKPD